MGKSSKEENVYQFDKRKFLDVLKHDVTNYIYFFAPLVIFHNIGW